MRLIIKRASTNLWIALGSHPRTFSLYIRMKDHITGKRLSQDALYTKKTELVIGGYPRSANTFAVEAFKTAQTRPVSIAHHLHAPSQIIRAVRDGKPVLLIVRDPRDAVASFLIRNPEITIRDALNYYVGFHEKVRPYVRGCVVTSYESVTRRFDEVIRRLNRRFSTDFATFEPTEENINACFARIERLNEALSTERDFEKTVARPSAQRKAARAALVREMASEPYAPRFQRARGLYLEYTALMDGTDRDGCTCR